MNDDAIEQLLLSRGALEYRVTMEEAEENLQFLPETLENSFVASRDFDRGSSKRSDLAFGTAEIYSLFDFVGPLLVSPISHSTVIHAIE